MVCDADNHSRHARHREWMSPECQPSLASIIIPTFNRAALVGDAIASAAAQTYRPLEIIVVDDGSTDRTAQVIRDRQEQLQTDQNLTLRYIHQPNAGVGAARNRGLIESRGEFIQFLDSDDLLHPQKLSLQIEALRNHPECGYILSGGMKAENLPEWTPITANNVNAIESAKFYCGREVWLTMVGVYRRRTCRQAGPFSEDMTLGEDEEFNLRVLLATAKVIYLSGALCALRCHTGPRLTDTHKGRTGMIQSVRMYRRMIESARKIRRLNDPRLVSALTKCLTDTAIGAMQIACPDLAAEALNLCRKLPLPLARRVRLAMYQIFNSLPSGTFPRFWPLWLKFRHAILKSQLAK
jgi:glycosyltransferase involved in cell wall biosynthesis